MTLGKDTMARPDGHDIVALDYAVQNAKGFTDIVIYNHPTFRLGVSEINISSEPTIDLSFSVYIGNILVHKGILHGRQNIFPDNVHIPLHLLQFHKVMLILTDLPMEMCETLRLALEPTTVDSVYMETTTIPWPWPDNGLTLTIGRGVSHYSHIDMPASLHTLADRLFRISEGDPYGSLNLPDGTGILLERCTVAPQRDGTYVLYGCRDAICNLVFEKGDTTTEIIRYPCDRDASDTWTVDGITHYGPDNFIVTAWSDKIILKPNMLSRGLLHYERMYFPGTMRLYMINMCTTEEFLRLSMTLDELTEYEQAVLSALSSMGPEYKRSRMLSLTRRPGAPVEPCPVCLTVPSLYFRAGCKHLFCLDCASRLETYRCPLCRADFSMFIGCELQEIEEIEEKMKPTEA